MFRVMWRSLTEPLRSPGALIVLVACMLAQWFGFLLMLVVAERANSVPWNIGQARPWILGVMALPILALTLPMISGEAKDRTLLLNLMQPITREAYYSGRVIGRALFSGLYFLVTLAGTGLVISIVSGMLFRGSGTNPLPPDLTLQLVFIGMTLVSAVFSMCAIAPVSSSRYGHVAYWSGFLLIVVLARDLAGANALERGFRWAALEVLQPFLVGTSPEFIRDAALGDWYLGRALLQWAFGVALAYLLGIFVFSRMEVARRV